MISGIILYQTTSADTVDINQLHLIVALSPTPTTEIPSEKSMFMDPASAIKKELHQLVDLQIATCDKSHL
jgi:hypothetical protein